MSESFLTQTVFTVIRKMYKHSKTYSTKDEQEPFYNEEMILFLMRNPNNNLTYLKIQLICAKQ